MDLEDKLRVEYWVNLAGLVIVLLQWHPENKQKLAPVASWGNYLESMESDRSLIVLELKALWEGS